MSDCRQNKKHPHVNENDVKYLEKELSNNKFSEVKSTVHNHQDEQRQQHDKEW